SSTATSCPAPPRTSVPCALVRREWASRARPSTTRDAPSTASSPTSCFREVTSLVVTEPVASPSTARSSPTRTSRSVTPDPASCRWPTPAPTRTDRSSSSAPSRRSGSTASTACSVVSLRDSTSSSRSSPSDLSRASRRPPSSSLTVDNSLKRRHDEHSLLPPHSLTHSHSLLS
ncbi:hypothetical protein PRIPAC_88809, partial [Pristionchus pacificus]